MFLFQNTDVEWSHTQWKTSEFMPEEFGATLITSHNKHAVLSPINPITNKKFLLSKSIPIKNYHSHPYGEYGYKAAIPSKADLKVRDRLDKRAGIRGSDVCVWFDGGVMSNGQLLKKE